MSDTRFITPLVHPASVMRGRHALAPVQVLHLKRLAADPAPSLPRTDRAPEGCLPDPSLPELRRFLQDLEADAAPTIVFDIENAGPHLICCGMVRLDPATGAPAQGVCFRFRHKGGEPWWPAFQEHLEVTTILDRILGDPRVRKVGHFIIQHDLPLLLDLGFVVRGPLLDTSALCHAVHSELRKGLQFLATAFCGAPRWKDIPDEKDGADSDAAEEEDA